MTSSVAVATAACRRRLSGWQAEGLADRALLVFLSSV